MSARARSRTALIVSPHPDDAALSLGGSILGCARLDIIVWNVFSHQSYSLIDREPEAAQRRILQEESDVATALGTRVVMGGFAEAELRGYVRLSQRFGQDEGGVLGRPDERGVIDGVRAAFERLLADVRPAVVGVPAGIGGHVDHLIACHAALACLPHAHRARATFLYEDLPYALNAGWRTRRLAELDARGLRLRERLMPIGASLARKRQALEIYRSQLRPRDIRDVIGYGEELGGASGGAERIWRLSAQAR